MADKVVSCRGTANVLAVAAFIAIAAISPVQAGQVTFGPGNLGGSSVGVSVKSFEALKFTDTIHQAYDYSCGSAALATLLTYSYGVDVLEKSVFLDMIKHGDRATIEKNGFSLLDMKDYLARRNLQAGGFKAPLSKLAQVGVPAIVLINHDGYRHFVVVRGVEDGRVLLSDPSLGTRAVSAANFTKEWNGIFFLILTDANRAQETFNSPTVWAKAPHAPGDLARFQIDLLKPPTGGIRDPNFF